MSLFRDRSDAAQQLIRLLPGPGEADAAPWLVLALPRGGVPIAAALARHLQAPLDLLIVRKVGAPGNRELALGAVTGPEPQDLVVNEPLMTALGLSRDDVERLAGPAVEAVASRRRAWSGSAPQLPLAGKAVLIVDDGVATGTTLRAAIEAARRQGAAQIAVAVPVALGRVLQRLPADVGPVFCPFPDSRLPAIGAAYDAFPQVEDSEVARILADFRLSQHQIRRNA